MLHRASLAEMAVPYGDPNFPYIRKCAFDVVSSHAHVRVLCQHMTHLLLHLLITSQFVRMLSPGGMWDVRGLARTWQPVMHDSLESIRLWHSDCKAQS